MLRGVKCNICGALGSHYSSTCTQKVTVGVPVGLRGVGVGVGVGAGVGAGAVSAPAVLPAMDDMFVSAAEVEAAIRKRPDVPSFLRCAACIALASQPLWCACCDIFVCHDCLGPPQGVLMCPVCEHTGVDNFHVIAAMRAMIAAWFTAVAAVVDPYDMFGEGGGGGAPTHPGSNKRGRR
jgi:hypothetical protein